MLKYVLFSKSDYLFGIYDNKEKALRKKDFFEKGGVSLVIKEIDFSELDEKLYNVLQFMKYCDIQWTEITNILLHEITDYLVE